MTTTWKGRWWRNRAVWCVPVLLALTLCSSCSYVFYALQLLRNNTDENVEVFIRYALLEGVATDSSLQFETSYPLYPPAGTPLAADSVAIFRTLGCDDPAGFAAVAGDSGTRFFRLPACAVVRLGTLIQINRWRTVQTITVTSAGDTLVRFDGDSMRSRWWQKSNRVHRERMPASCRVPKWMLVHEVYR